MINPIETARDKISKRYQDYLISDYLGRYHHSPNWRVDEKGVLKWQDGHPVKAPPTVHFVTLLFVGSTAAPIVILLFGAIISPLSHLIVAFAAAYLPVVVLQAMFGAVTLAIGTGLYVLRCRLQEAYGVVECAIGVIAAAYVANLILYSDSVPKTEIFSEAAALYIIVRGYDNIYKSIATDDRRKTWNTWFFGKAEVGKLA